MRRYLLENKVKIVVATHKAYAMPTDEMYIPIHVGATLHPDLDLGYQKDNVGDNISEKNDSYSELTGLYWAWKNLDAPYIGLAHYRRHFGAKHHRGKNRMDWIIKSDELLPLLDDYDIILPKKRHYYIESLYSHYKHTHYANQLDATREVISELYPDYLDTYDQVLAQTSGYMFNMVVMKKELLDQYCTWLFNILFALEKKMGSEKLSSFQQRFYGRVSEIIFNVWLQQQIKLGTISPDRIKELPLVYIEGVNWWKKGVAFLKAKFFHKRYENSF